MSKQVTVISIAPYSYIHVLNTNTNVTSVVCGPARYTRQDHERLVCGPTEIAHSKALMEMEVTKKKQLAAIESNKFKNMIDAIGQDTITNIARAGPEMQAKLLSGLGIKSMMITDGKSPINLFQTAQQMIAQPGSSSNNNVMGMMANMQQQQQQSVDNVDE